MILKAPLCSTLKLSGSVMEVLHDYTENAESKIIKHIIFFLILTIFLVMGVFMHPGCNCIPCKAIINQQLAMKGINDK